MGPLFPCFFVAYSSAQWKLYWVIICGTTLFCKQTAPHTPQKRNVSIFIGTWMNLRKKFYLTHSVILSQGMANAFQLQGHIPSWTTFKELHVGGWKGQRKTNKQVEQQIGPNLSTVDHIAAMCKSEDPLTGTPQHHSSDTHSRQAKALDVGLVQAQWGMWHWEESQGWNRETCKDLIWTLALRFPYCKLGSITHSGGIGVEHIFVCRRPALNPSIFQ